MNYQRLPEESAKAYQAFMWYCEMGAARSLEKVAQKYNKSVSLLGRWSRLYHWVERAVTWDEAGENAKEQARKAEIERVVSEGFAAMHNRVAALNDVAEDLYRQLGSRKNVWVRDVKTVGFGESSRVEDLERFNSAIFDQFRGTLDDIAKEVGGRIKKKETTLKIIPKQYIGLGDLLTETEQIEREQGFVIRQEEGSGNSGEEGSA